MDFITGKHISRRTMLKGMGASMGFHGCNGACNVLSVQRKRDAQQTAHVLSLSRMSMALPAVTTSVPR